MVRKVLAWFLIAFGVILALILLIGRNPASAMPRLWATIAGACMFVFPAWIAAAVLLFSRAPARTSWGRLLVGLAAPALGYLVAWKAGSPPSDPMDSTTFVFGLVLLPGLLLAVGLALILVRLGRPT